jgi:hypothetical protein
MDGFSLYSESGEGGVSFQSNMLQEARADSQFYRTEEPLKWGSV